MIVVVDYEAGNIYNVGNALKHLGVDYVLSGDPAVIAEADRVILPGVGAAAPAMESLSRQGISPVLTSLRVPFLGICLGLQLLFERTEEEDCRGLGILPGTVRRFDTRQVKVPHMGWNSVSFDTSLPETLSTGIPNGAYFYFVHAYYAPPGAATVATTNYSLPFSSVVRHGNYLGVQFHPERSSRWGLQLLENFARRTAQPDSKRSPLRCGEEE